jgi:hypothetical protein
MFLLETGALSKSVSMKELMLVVSECESASGPSPLLKGKGMKTSTHHAEIWRQMFEHSLN